MSKYLFKTKCPACRNMEIISWCHDAKKCGGDRYIDEDLYLHCNKCNDKTFLFNATFDCGKHDSRMPEYQQIFAALEILHDSSDIPEDIIEEMVEKAIINRKSLRKKPI